MRPAESAASMADTAETAGMGPLFLPEAVLFDFDGTLVDSMNMWTEIDVEYLSRFGKEYTPDLDRAIEGMNTKEMCAYFRMRYQIPRTDREMVADWVEMSRHKYLHEIPLKPFVKEYLEFLSKKGVPMGIATSTELDIAIPCLKSHGIDSFFKTVTTTTEAGAGKPDPAVYLLAAARLGAAPEKCLAFEDLPAGILAAKKAGMTVVAVEDRFSADRKEQKAALADRFIRDFSEMLGQKDAVIS